MIRRKPKRVVKRLREIYKENVKKYIKEHIVAITQQLSDTSFPEETNLRESLVRRMRDNTFIFYNKVNDKNQFQDNIIITEESAINQPYHINTCKSHIIVFVHGLGGSFNDMLKYSNMISIIYPKTIIKHFDISPTKTFGDIDVIGCQLADELLSYFENFFFTSDYVISFIGHSLGGLIIRTALPYLESLKTKFHMYLSLSTPHLGTAEYPSLISAGFKIFKLFSKSQSLNQLSLKDSKTTDSSFIYKLSEKQGMN